ncbi:MAG: hypothetical protein HY290_13895 [Planctomycetia bacterium]|nr:hypothetical protein [Planctomycetia bacterium]
MTRHYALSLWFVLPVVCVAPLQAQSPAAIPARDTAGAPLLEIASFARVMTCDPNRREGAQSNRLQEFPKEDVFLEQELIPVATGFYQVPAASGQRCIGLSWPEKRLLNTLTLDFKNLEAIPPPEKVTVQYWSSKNRELDDMQGSAGIFRSPWQGMWQALPGRIKKEGNRLIYQIDADQVPEFVYQKGEKGTDKIRWIWPAAGDACDIRRPAAQSRNSSAVGKFRIELDRPRPGQQAVLEMSNGYWAEGAATTSPLTRAWDLGQPLIVTARYAVPPTKADLTLLRFEMPGAGFPEAGFSVALEDVLTSGGVFVRDFGVYVTPDPPPLSLADYKRKIAGRQTTLDQVRRLPDQTFARAKQQLLNPLCARDPMILSLACDNSKFLLQREGVLVYPAKGNSGVFQYDAAIHPRFLSAPRKEVDAARIRAEFYIDEKLERHLENGWYPIPVVTAKEQGLLWRQRTFIAPFDKDTSPGRPAWINRKPLCVVEYSMENPGKDAAETSFSLRVAGVDSIKEVERGVAIQKGMNLYAFIDRSGANQWRQAITDNLIEYRGTIPAGGKWRVVACVPGWRVPPEDYASLAVDVEVLASRTKDYWRRILDPAMQIETPEAQLNDIIRASQVNSLLLFCNHQDGKLIEPSGGSSIGPLDTLAQCTINGLDLAGHGDVARDCLNYFLSRYNDQGFLAPNYAIMGTAQNLWTLGQHYQLSRDEAWLRSIAPQLLKACRWIIQQRDKTKQLRPNGEKAPEYGLFTPQSTLCDWDRYSYNFYANAFYYAGLKLVASSLADIQDPAAEALLQEAQEYYQDLMRAWRWNQARMPVWPLADGTWAPAWPSSLYCFGLTSDFQGSSIFPPAHDVEYGGGHLVNLGLLDPKSPEAGWINDFLEDYWFFQPLASNYSAAVIKGDWYTYGGFSKIHPGVTRNVEMSAARDDVKPFIRSYFNTMFPVLSGETLAFWEHIGFGDWNGAYEAGNFLRRTRMMFVMERGQELWLAPFVTNQWMHDGMRVKIRNAPTNFGPVNYQIDSRVNDGIIEAEIDPPARNAMNALVIRLRHPQQKKMHRVTVNGQETQDFDPEREIVRLKAASGRIMIRAFY